MYPVQFTPLRSNTSVKRAQGGSSKKASSSFSITGEQQTSLPVSSILLNSTVPIDSLPKRSDDAAIQHSQEFLGELEQWRRRLITGQNARMDDLVGIQKGLETVQHASSPKVQDLIDQVRILVAVEIAKRQPPQN